MREGLARQGVDVDTRAVCARDKRVLNAVYDAIAGNLIRRLDVLKASLNEMAGKIDDEPVSFNGWKACTECVFNGIAK